MRYFERDRKRKGKIRGMFRTQSNTYDGAFYVKIGNVLKPLSIFAEKLHHRCLTGFYLRF